MQQRAVVEKADTTGLVFDRGRDGRWALHLAAVYGRRQQEDNAVVLIIYFVVVRK